jgi:hypothetical protein
VVLALLQSIIAWDLSKDLTKSKISAAQVSGS